PLLRFPVGERRHPPQREERVREDLGPDERVLPVARAEDAVDALLVRPGFRIGELAHASGDARVTHPCQAAAKRVERLERLKTEELRVSMRADHLTLVLGAERMRAVLDDLQVVPLRERENRMEVARHAVEMR